MTEAQPEVLRGENDNQSATLQHTQKAGDKKPLFHNATQVGGGHRGLAHSSCPHGAENDISMILFGQDCTNLVPGHAMDQAECVWRANSNSGMMGLKAGNTYTLRWKSATASDRNVEIFIQETDGDWFSPTHCADLQPAYWIHNQAYSGSIVNSPNEFTFTMPDLRRMSCANDFLGGFPEFQFRIRTENECHRGTWGAFT